ncbi:acyl-CoA dehydrogenase C-terminal domain-containing protein [Dactylosporangium sucinum]|uniref:UvrC family homology region profile domain-containing protein n=2 Tax=Dactylosporangium sucinum TaxID=1424081 RepID=A0A917U1A1_9ACTN|nr:hypothetical protein GCM10007977_061250 [Dactylosporangium sucinum]
MLLAGTMKRQLLPEARAGVGAAFVLLCLVLAAEVADGTEANYIGLAAAAPFLAAAFCSWPEVLAVGSAASLLAFVFSSIELMHSRDRALVLLLNLGAVLVASGIACAVGAIRQRQIARYAELSRLASVAQGAVLRPLGPQLGPLTIAARYISASAAADIGGDLYEAVETPYGVRMIIGDVRGKGLDAVRLASIVLGSYRHVAFERADLRAIVADLDRAVARSVGDEDFVTAALIEERGGTLTIVNCGHPAPLLLRRGRLGHEALQTFGGSGFLQDYPLEQYVRDSKIDTLYEGTTAIQSLDLVFRKIVKDQGKALLVVAGEIQQFLEAEGGNGQLKLERVALGKALTEAQQILGIFTGWLGEAQGGDPEAVYKVGLNSRRFLLALGDIVVGWLLQRQAEVALKALAGEVSAADKSFYEGKVAAAKFFAHEILPRVGADRRIVESTTLDAMQLSEDAF